MFSYAEMVSKPVSQAYAERQTPPSPIILLLSHTQLHDPVLPPLLMHQDLENARAKRTAPTSTPNNAEIPTAQIKQHIRFSLPPADDKRATTSPLPDLTDSSEEDDHTGEDDHTYPPDTILAPSSLTTHVIENHVGWRKVFTDEETSAIKTYIKMLSLKLKLDTTQSFKFQNKATLEILYREACAKYPKLNKFSKHWGIRCILMAQLKSSSATARSAGTQALADATVEMADAFKATRLSPRNKKSVYK